MMNRWQEQQQYQTFPLNNYQYLLSIMQICNTDSQRKIPKQVARSLTEINALPQNRLFVENRPLQEEILFNLPLQPEEDVSVQAPTIVTNERNRIAPRQLSGHSPIRAHSKQIQSCYQWDPVVKYSELSLSDLTPKGTKKRRRKVAAQDLAKTFLKTMVSKVRPILSMKSRKAVDDLTDQSTFLLQIYPSLVSAWPTFGDLYVWNHLLMGILCVIAMITPLRLGFRWTQMLFIDYALITVFPIDMALNFNKSYVENGSRVTDQCAIRKHYLKSRFLFDLVAFVLIVLTKMGTNHFASTLFSIGFLALKTRKFLYFEYYMLAVFLVHNLTCFHIHLMRHAYSGLDPFSQYHNSLFHTLLNLRGSVSIEPNTAEHTLYCNTCLVLPCTLVVYVLKMLKKPRLEFQDKNVRSDLVQVVNHYLNQNQVKAVNFQRQAQMMQVLPEKLQEEVHAEILKGIVDKCKFLKKFRFQNFYYQTESYQPNEVILQREQEDESCLYVIGEGEVMVEKEAVENYFGEYGFFTGLRRKNEVVSKGYTKVYKIGREEFMEDIQGNAHDYEVFCFMRDSIVLKEDVSMLGVRCVLCNKADHYVNSYKERVLKAHLYSRPNLRRKFGTRKDLKKKNSLATNKEFQKKMTQLQQTYMTLNDNMSSLNELSREMLPYDDMIYKESFSSAQSLSKQRKSTYEQNSFPNAQEGLMQFGEFETVNRQSDKMQDDMLFSLMRKNEQKGTFNTAGFGKQNQPSLKQSQTIEEMQIIQESDEQLSIMDESEGDVTKLNVSKVRPQKEPKLTFNLEDAEANLFNQFASKRQNSNQHSSHQESVRQNSSRSQTYTPLQSQYSQNPSLSHKSISKIYQSSSSQIRKKPISQHDEQSNIQRDSSRRKSSHTKVSINCSNFQIFSGLENPLYVDQVYSINLDKMQNFKVYFPHNNCSRVLRQLQKPPKPAKFSKYFFDFAIANGLKRKVDLISLD